MIKLLKIKTYWMAFFVALLVSFIMAAQTHAQTPSDSNPEDVAAKYGVTFPIAELGGCTDLTSCRTYCEDPVNSSSCINYAKQKGFYQEDKFEVKDNTLAAAKSRLGCDSYASCLNFCEVPANYDKCDSFAKSQGLVGGHVDDPSRTQVIAKAREFLGCDSAAGCQSYCSLEENRQKCSEFAKTVGLYGGERQVGPGGCTSEATCKAFCSDPNNYQICSGFSSTSGGTFTGPGGCSSEQSCRSYCQANPSACGYVGGGPGASPPPGYNSQEMCNKTPNCSWKGNTCQCGFYGETVESQNRAKEYADYCQKNPDQCKVGPGGYPIPKDKASQLGVPPGGYHDYRDYCKKNPVECLIYQQQGAPSGGYVQDPATECAKYGCTWANNSCQCTNITPSGSPPSSGGCPSGQYIGPGGYCIPSSGGTYSPPPYYSPGPTSTYYPTSTSYPTATYQPTYDPASACSAQPGCSWTGSTCQCSSSGGTTTSSPAPTSEPASTTQPTSTESTPPPTTTESSGGSSGGSCPSGYYMMDGNCVQGVQGVSTARGLLQLILDWLRQ